MTQRTLYKLIEKIGSRHFASEEEMLGAMLDEIVDNERIQIHGGRVWKLLPDKKKYRLIHEQGIIESVGVGFTINLKGYAVFDRVARHRTVLADETHKTLRKKGIIKYSATGIGDAITIGRTPYYEYLMAFNAIEVDRELMYMLSIVGQAATQMLAKLHSDEEKDELLSEMELARDLQRRLLPEHEHSFGPYELYGVSIPEKTVGGDFFNYYSNDTENDRLGVAVGDAASKGFSAAVQALFVSGALMMSVEAETKMSSALRRINTINRRIFPNDRFVTLFYCELFDGDEGLMLYSNAGHCKPMHYHSDEDVCSELSVTGPIIGLLPDSHFGIANTNLGIGDVLVLYSDGITEANNGQDEYEEKRLEKVLLAKSELSAKQICLEILQDVQTFSANGSYSDDKTVVVIKRVR